MLYLAVVLDRFNPGIVGGPIKPCMRADLVIHALTMAWLRRKPAPGALHHSDRASQYVSHGFQRRLVQDNVRC